MAEEKKMDGFPLPHTQFKQVFVLLTLGRVTPTTKALYRTNRKICWPLSMIDKTGLSPCSPHIGLLQVVVVVYMAGGNLDILVTPFFHEKKKNLLETKILRIKSRFDSINSSQIPFLDCTQYVK